jgi:predicted nuclease of predicted toxin-antitoxin system
VKFLVDAQLPVRLCRVLTERGHEPVHTSELPDGNRTSDADIARIAERLPRRLLVIATGKITNNELLELLARHLDTVVAAFDDSDFLELGRGRLVVHERPDDY